MSIMKKIGLRRRRSLKIAAHPRCRKTYRFESAQVHDCTIDHSGTVKLQTSRAVFSYPSAYRKNNQFIGRLHYSEALGKGHERLAAKVTFAAREKAISEDLRFLIAPALRAWSEGEQKLQVVELGPSYTTVIPEALQEVVDCYTAVDYSAAFLARQKDFLDQIPHLSQRCKRVVSDTYDLELAAESADLIVTSCHPPFVSAPVVDCMKVIAKVHGILKPGGYFAVFPWSFSEHAPAVNEFLLSKFHLRQVFFKCGLSERLLVLLEKK